LLPKDLQHLCTPVRGEETIHTTIYRLLPPEKRLFQHLLSAAKIPWNEKQSKALLVKAKQQMPLRDIHDKPAHRLIDIQSLSIRENHRVLAASLFADISGFTRFIEDAEQKHMQETALRLFHAIRREMTSVIQDDYHGIHVQFQGDRIQGLFHLPGNDEQAIATEAICAAMGLQSSMEGPLKALLPYAEPLHLTIGIAIGETFVSRLGVRRHRDAICLGPAAEEAARLEGVCNGRQIGISRRLHQALPVELQSSFRRDKKRCCHIATNLTRKQVERWTRDKPIAR
jgi:class 3 adenylate cyclase